MLSAAFVTNSLQSSVTILTEQTQFKVTDKVTLRGKSFQHFLKENTGESRK